MKSNTFFIGIYFFIYFQIGTDTNLSMNTEELDVTNNMESQVRSNNHSNTNGSIITMTMKNNHLIVETEERNVSIII